MYPKQKNLCSCGRSIGHRKDKCESCYRKAIKKRNMSDPAWIIKKRERDRIHALEYRRKKPFNVWIANLRTRAKRKDLDFNLTLKDLVIPEYCPVLGMPLRKIFGGHPTDDLPTVDRIDNNKGYTTDNIKIISWKANRMKSNYTLEDIESLYKYMKDLH